MSSRIAIVSVWLLALAACCVWMYRSLTVTTDLTNFLPPSATPAQRLLISQLREGAASRLILIALDGDEPAALARSSSALVAQLQATGLFSYVANGDASALERKRALLFEHRYLLSPGVTPERFSAAGLAASLHESLALLASPAGVLVRSTLPADPTGEMLRLARTLSAEPGARMSHGVWFSRDGTRALLIAETLAAGFNVDAQRAAMQAVQRSVGSAREARLRVTMAGPGVFASEMRDAIESDARVITLATVLLVLAILFAVYRSLTVIGASTLPVVSGLVAGITIVGVVFGPVHGITIAFGATLVGEAVDYPSYVFLQSVPGERLHATLKRIWPTLRLAVLTTVLGTLAMALSSFAGLAQLGVLTIAGVIVAGLVTRWVVPAVVPNGLAPRVMQQKPFIWSASATIGARLRAISLAVTVAALAVIVWRHDRLWDDDLANLSPIPEAAKALDRSLREELGASDVRYLVVARGADREAALRASEAAAQWLQDAVARNWISGFDVPSAFLPSERTQEQRRAALPDAATLRRHLDSATRELPFREGLFVPFLDAVERARAGALLDIGQLRGSALGTKVSALLTHNADGWTALAPLRGVAAPHELANAARAAGHELLDLKTESNELVNGYRSESLKLIAFGLACIAIQLAWGLRSIARAAQVLAPVLAAVVIDVALLLLAGKTLSLFNLVALLLVVGIGLNYALFFQRPQQNADEELRTQRSLFVCAATTLAAFGCLAISRTPVLHAIGVTVALGALMSLILAAIWARPRT
jgi:predicted exporter